MIRIKIALLLLMLATLSQAMAGQLSTVSVTSKGFGVSEPEAISDAVINGVAQVNGESIASSMRIKKQTASSTQNATTSERTIEKDLSRRTQGVVKSWKKISASSSAGGFTATVAVNVVVMRRSDQLKRMKLAVVSSTAVADDLTIRLVEELTGFLTSSRKFAVMDRRQGEAIQSQLDRIRSGSGPIEDRARLSAEVAPDFIAVTSLNMVTSGDKRIAEASLEIIDYATRQIKFHEKKTLPISSGDQIVINKRITVLSKRLSRSVLETVYPPMVVGLGEDGLVTISQGLGFYSVGDKCVIKEISGKLTDPHTKEFLGYSQTEVGAAEIISADKRMSQARLSQGIQLSPEKIAEHKYLVVRSGDAPEDVFKMLEPSDKSGIESGGSAVQQDDDY